MLLWETLVGFSMSSLLTPQRRSLFNYYQRFKCLPYGHDKLLTTVNTNFDEQEDTNHKQIRQKFEYKVPGTTMQTWIRLQQITYS